MTSASRHAGTSPDQLPQRYAQESDARSQRQTTLPDSEAETSLKLLLIEANESRVEQLRTHVAAHDHLKGRYVATARQAISVCHEATFDCVILSDGLPDMDSLGLISLLRNQHTLQQLPVFMLISQRDDQDTIAALRGGASEVLAWDRLSADLFAEKITSTISREDVRHALSQSRLENEIAALEMTRRQQMMQGSLDELVHALRTPLGSINEFVSLVLDGVGGQISEQQGKFLALARGACWTLDREISSVYDIADITRDLEASKIETALAQDVLELVLSELSMEAEALDVSLNVIYEEELAPIRADALQICQVMLQLSARAMSIAGSGGQVTLEALPLSGSTDTVEIALEVHRSQNNVLHIRNAINEQNHSGASLSDQLRITSCEEILASHNTTLQYSSIDYDAAKVSFTLESS